MLSTASSAISMGVDDGDPKLFKEIVDADLEIIFDREIHLREVYPDEGFLFDYVAYATKMTDAPKIYHLFTGLAVAGAAIGRDVYIPFGATPIYANIWAMIISPPGFYHKSTCLTIAGNIIRETFTNILTLSKFTGEYLIKALSENPIACIFPSEIKGFMNSIQKEYNKSLTDDLTELFDVPQRWGSGTIGAGKVEIERPFITIVGAGTNQLFEDSVKQGDVLSGFWTRFILITEDKKEQRRGIPPAPTKSETDKIKKALSKIAGLKGEAVLSKDAREIYETWLFNHEKKFNDLTNKELLIGFWSRLSIYCLKIALIYEVSNSRELEISLQSIYKAIITIEYLKRKLVGLVGEYFGSKLDKDINRAIKLLKKHPGGLSMRDFYKRLNMHKADGLRLKDTMIAHGRITNKENGDIILRDGGE